MRSHTLSHRPKIGQRAAAAGAVDSDCTQRLTLADRHDNLACSAEVVLVRSRLDNPVRTAWKERSPEYLAPRPARPDTLGRSGRAGAGGRGGDREERTVNSDDGFLIRVCPKTPVTLRHGCIRLREKPFSRNLIHPRHEGVGVLGQTLITNWIDGGRR